MILLDTHIWVWWVHGDAHLTEGQWALLQANEAHGLGVSVISCWEVGKLVKYNRLTLPCAVPEWLEQALASPGIQLLDITPRIAAESKQLPPGLHRDIADQILVATARVLGCSLLTADHKILDYPHVNVLR